MGKPVSLSGSEENRQAGSASLFARHSLFFFFVLAYAISWGISLFAVQGLLPFRLPRLVIVLAGLLYHFGPAAAGLIMAGVEAGRRGVGRLLKSILQLKVNYRWYVWIILYPLLLRLAAAGVSMLLGSPPPTFFDSSSLGLPAGNPVVMAGPIFLSVLILTGIAEEVGWRGFALPRLQSKYSVWLASLILALLWAPWHYNPLNFPAIQSFLIWHVLAVIAMTFLLTWVYNGTGASLGMAVLFHTFSNFSDWVVPTSPLVNGSQQTFIIQVILNLATVVVVSVLTKDLGLSAFRRSQTA